MSIIFVSNSDAAITALYSGSPIVLPASTSFLPDSIDFSARVLAFCDKAPKRVVADCVAALITDDILSYAESTTAILSWASNVIRLAY
ncbi:hypothetical protein [Chitinophaga skermanii]|uniref:hypothetical protein n=1 Tax=Chitinophaga skermanii TaxID=331697 RepID=UPI001314C329|nr:hypothetical protein [Chitinophaga skermanii]